MINFLSNWIEQIAMAVIITSIFELILPKGNVKKYVKVILGIYIIFCMISPFVNSSNLFNFEDINQYITNSTKEASTQVDQTSMDSRLEQLYVEEIKKDIEKQVQTYGYKVKKSTIDADLNNASSNPGIHKINLILERNAISSIEKVEINIGDKVDTNEEQPRGEIETIKNELAKTYEIDPGIITIKTTK